MAKRTKAANDAAAWAFEALEPRLLLSADPLAAAVGAGLAVDVFEEPGDVELSADALERLFATAPPREAPSDSAAPTPPPPPIDSDALASVLGIAPDSEENAVEDVQAEGLVDHDGSNAEPRKELVFIDSGIANYEQLVAGLTGGRDVEVVSLDSSGDGIEQISDVLGEHSQIDALHIVTHGREGGVQLGNTWLTWDRVTSYAEAIEGWGDALTEDADLLLYGCNLAGSAQGQALIESVARLSGADVAASDDLTGSAALGGNWDLEYAAGTIEADIAFGIQAQQNWTGDLAWFDANTGTPQGGPSTGADLFVGDAGNDTGINASGGDDVLYGNDGDDDLDGSSDNDLLLGGAGVDTLTGQSGNDILLGGPDADSLVGGSGDDILMGGGGNDTLGGGNDDDLFLFGGAQDGDVYTVDGGNHTNTIDVSEFGAGNVTLGSGTITVNLGGGQSFVINHTNVQNIVRAEDGGNHAAQADAGPDQPASTSSLVTLDASASSDPDSDPLTYDWQQIEGTWVTLSDRAAVSPTFTAPASADDLTFAVTVSDGSTSDVDIVQIKVSTGDFVVTNTNANGAGSLEWAIGQANATPGFNTITFSIAGVGPHVITVDSDGLPVIDDAVFIDGWSEPNYVNKPVIQIDGSSSSEHGIRLFAGSTGSIIRGLSITHR